MAGTKIDVAFIGSCTNARLSTARSRAVVAGHRSRRTCAALVVPDRRRVAAAEREGLTIFRAPASSGAGRLLDVPGDESRSPRGREVCASSSNRNFKGPQGSPTGRTLLMSPAMVAAAAVPASRGRRTGPPVPAWATAR
jgi:3-isopropylmalate/(R)-2-methylmalate dehydratase large subunit